MIARTYTVAFLGIEARLIEVQCALTPGLPSFSIVGLGDRAVAEAKDRIRAALNALAIALPSKRITVNLSPADLPKEGSHFDLPIAIALLAAIGCIPVDEAERLVSLGELSLDGQLVRVNGALPAALTAASTDCHLVCPQSCGQEAAWIDKTQVLGAKSLLEITRHFSGKGVINPATAGLSNTFDDSKDLKDVKGQERAKRALEIAAAGRHNLLLVGPPGSGKSMLSARIPGILPALRPEEALETSMIHSLAGLLEPEGISLSRPYRAPHHTASMAAIVGGGRGAKPGEISLAHNGVLFMDELPEFPRTVLECLRQPLETGDVVVSRANAHVTYPCQFMMVAAANPCRCGHFADAELACSRAPICSDDYLGKISGPLLDRFDLRIDVPPVSLEDLNLPQSGSDTAETAARVAGARNAQTKRYETLKDVKVNADIEGDTLEEVASPDEEGRSVLIQAAERFKLSARGYHRILRVARTIADLDESTNVRAPHVAEAIGYRQAG